MADDVKRTRARLWAITVSKRPKLDGLQGVTAWVSDAGDCVIQTWGAAGADRKELTIPAEHVEAVGEWMREVFG